MRHHLTQNIAKSYSLQQLSLSIPLVPSSLLLCLSIKPSITHPLPPTHWHVCYMSLLFEDGYGVFVPCATATATATTSHITLIYQDLRGVQLFPHFISESTHILTYVGKWLLLTYPLQKCLECEIGDF